MNTKRRKKPIASVHTGNFAIAGALSIATGVLCGGFGIYYVSTALGSSSDFQIDAALELITGIAVIVGLAAIFIFGGRRLRMGSRVRSAEREEYEEGHSTAQGIVLERFKQTRGGMDSYTTYHVVVQFDTKAGPYILSADVPKRLFRSTIPEGPINVRYADTDPTIALLEGEF